ncbi:MAG: bacteriochlorophyll/chlorophyll synthetase, partial [Pseudomonadota bacterium]
PVTMGVKGAARFACLVMAAAQIVVIALLVAWQLYVSAALVAGVLAAQLAAMPRLLSDPAKYAPWYNAVGVLLYVLGMLAAALGLGGYV